MQKHFDKTQCGEKGISSSVGILIIIIIAIIAFGGVFAYQYFTPKTQPVVQPQQTANRQTNNIQPNNQNNIQQLSDATIISAIDKLEAIQLEKNAQGIYEAKYPKMQGGYDVNLIVRGDLNGDGFEDSFVWSTVCGASCGSIFTVVLNNGQTYRFDNIDGFITAGAAQYHPKTINISDGIISMKVEIPRDVGSVTSATLNYKLVGNNLVKF